MIGRPVEADTNGAAAAAPKPATAQPVWPAPAQWPPPDAEPPPPEVDPNAVRWPELPAQPAFTLQTPTSRPIPSPDLIPPEPEPAAAVVEVVPSASVAIVPAPPADLVPVTPVVRVPTAPTAARRRAVTWTRVAILALAALLGVSAISSAMNSLPGAAPTGPPTFALGSPLLVESGSPVATRPLLTPDPSFGPKTPTEYAIVTQIVDGDTIRVDINGTEHAVRYIGIDAPEPDATDPTLKQQADAATAANAALVQGQDVFLERDVTDTDQFDRLLRNVWLVDESGSQLLINLELVQRGFAKVTTFPPDEKYVDYLVAAQESARALAVGLWAPVPSPASSAVPTAASAPQASPQTIVGGGSDCHPSYTPCLPIVSDLDCADVRRMGKAPVTVKGPDEYRLDGSDNDGLGCE
jgi:endonuclease YncB( thermonuclease family)